MHWACSVLIQLLQLTWRWCHDHGSVLNPMPIVHAAFHGGLCSSIVYKQFYCPLTRNYCCLSLRTLLSCDFHCSACSPFTSLLSSYRSFSSLLNSLGYHAIINGSNISSEPRHKKHQEALCTGSNLEFASMTVATDWCTFMHQSNVRALIYFMTHVVVFSEGASTTGCLSLRAVLTLNGACATLVDNPMIGKPLHCKACSM